MTADSVLMLGRIVKLEKRLAAAEARIAFESKVAADNAAAYIESQVITQSHVLGLNPGGEVQFVELPARVEDRWIGRLLTRKEALEVQPLPDARSGERNG